MKRRHFIQSGVLGGIALLFSKSFWANEDSEVVLEDKAVSSQRGIEGVLSPTNTHMVGNGFKVMNYFPNGKGFEERMSPFFLMDFNAEVNFPPSDIAHGVGVHPHRGIETITFAFKGSVEHHDSKGNHGVIHPGDVQWMTAGAGVLHKEYHEQTFNRTGGAFEMLQLWINLPKKHKMATPKYQSIVHTEKPRVVLENNMGEICIVAGEYSGVKGIASTFSSVQLWDMHLNENADFNFQLPGEFNSGILVVDGSVVVNGKEVPENHYVQLKNEDGDIHVQAKRKCILLVLSGQPLNEPYVNYGPFVMNTEEEIRQAIQDYNAGKFGFLAD